ncbi:uncharacterized protein si:dkey-182g1.6 isoform X2 [Ctenopharyngodon idella]|uniref:uncharacterized protein si:dkey-182g1.6 isoform X2 n=1 Tax=Ctenopharyngodon idella TaxID=7959 RepID=UPI0022327106|nr:uncharacterized protein si:dkey-182g1.6 isoform X2 [Ctenopharyngodon idella]
MRNDSFLLCILLLVYGVFGADVDEVPVSVIEGDSVTLIYNVTEIQRDDKKVWMFEKKDIIAQIEGGKISIHDFSDGRFRERLELDSNGFLTIKNIKKQHGGLYKLDISGIYETSKSFRVTVRDKDNVESVSVIEGDSVTLNTGVTEIQRDDQILWKFGDQGALIARLNGPVDARMKNIHLNDQTGDLNIRDIQRDQYGNYKVEINTSRMILHRKFHIRPTVEAMKTVSVKEGESVTLRTGLIEIQKYDLILWKFEDHLIAEINKRTNQFILEDSRDERFKGRLQLNEKSGSLTISDSETTDSGDYHLNMSRSTHTLQRNIGVTVKAFKTENRTEDSGLHPGYVGLICVFVLLLLVAVGFVIYRRCRTKTSSNHSVQCDFSEDEGKNLRIQNN